MRCLRAVDRGGIGADESRSRAEFESGSEGDEVPQNDARALREVVSRQMRPDRERLPGESA